MLVKSKLICRKTLRDRGCVCCFRQTLYNQSLSHPVTQSLSHPLTMASFLKTLQFSLCLHTKTVNFLRHIDPYPGELESSNV